MTLKNISFVCAALLAAGLSVPTDAAPVAGQAAIARALDAFVASGAIPGYAVVLVTPQGEATLATGGVSATEIIGVASVTKVLTTVAFADLVRTGKLRVEDPVRTAVPEAAKLPRWEGIEITLWHLATHTSALPEGQMGESVAAKWYSPRVWRILFRRFVLRQGEGQLAGVTWDDIFAFLAATTLPRAPGSKWQYSNIGMGLLGYAVERNSGMTYEEKVLSTVCRPLGMEHTFLTLPEGVATRVHVKLGPLAPAGGFYSTAADLALFVKAALGMGTPRELMQDLEITYQPQGQDGDGKPLSLGWQLDGKSGRLYHSGLTHAFIGVDRKTKVGAVMILGAGYNGIENLGLAVLEALSGGKADFPKPRTAVDLPEKVLAGYAGAWRLDKNGSVEIKVEGKGLKAQFMKGGKKGGVAVLTPESGTKFFCRDWDCAVEFLPPSGGNPAAAKIRMYSWEGRYIREK